ncbi:hypothetical protein [Roseicella frigidaeris]|uniref:Uncharacterized protein n=1 Tax=Roseicella frigidaeris TaxID=2230885 RepID=A0A327M9E1_9PROT|nr:hypothetical protein [Roseicella frigidaeris]RAI59540.1 hypothetical protein DOO78_08050 [Roseicella frigidaeris]
MFKTDRWHPMDSAPRDGTVLCLADGREAVTGSWDGEAWVLFPEEEQRGRLDPRHFRPTCWMRVEFTPHLPRTAPGGVV